MSSTKPGGTGKAKAKPKSSTFKNRLEVIRAAPTYIYQRERSKVYTVICIAMVGLTLIGLGAGLVVYALDLSVQDLVIAGGLGIFIGLVSLFVALTFLVKPILERRRRTMSVATETQKKRNVSVAPGEKGYVYGYYSEVNLGKVSAPSQTELYELKEISSPEKTRPPRISVAHPTSRDEPTYDIALKATELAPISQ